ncbi:hypothetical protein [Bacillus mycoides]
MKFHFLKTIVAIAAVVVFTFAPATEKVKELNAPIAYVDPNPGGG